MANNENMSIETMINTMEKMLKNCKSKMNNAPDFLTLNGFYQYGLGILNTAGNFQVIDKNKYNEYSKDLKETLKERVVVLYKIDLNISEHSNMDCSVVINNIDELRILYEALNALGKINEKQDILTMTNFPYIVNLNSEPNVFVGTTSEYSAIVEEIKKGKTIVPFAQIYKGK